MDKIDVLNICETVLFRLLKMDYELNNRVSKEQLIFPNKLQATGNVVRFSEQELRFLFIEEFKKKYGYLYYSVETPTQEKYSFGKSYADILKNVDTHKRSASLDMCIFKRNEEKHYERILNIEFKHKNTNNKNIAKDILKLVREKQNGVFILLLNNTNKGSYKGTLWNENHTGIFNKLYKVFKDLNGYWNCKEKFVQVVIISLKQEKIIHRIIKQTDLENLEALFFIKNGCGNINELKSDSWELK